MKNKINLLYNAFLHPQNLYFDYLRPQTTSFRALMCLRALGVGPIVRKIILNKTMKMTSFLTNRILV